MIKKEPKGVLRSYWETLHSSYPSVDQLRPVINPDEPVLVNQLYDFGHRLGMRVALNRLGDLQAKKVLDIGCGRGRWSREFARRGAKVLGVDWSHEAIRLDRERMPECAFECLSVLELDRLASRSFDVVNSVTVIQHTQRDAHLKIFRDIHALLADAGRLCMLESIYSPVLSKRSAYQSGACTFYWTKEGWIDLAEKNGFRLVYFKGCLYRPLLRLYSKLTQAKPVDPTFTEGPVKGSRSAVKTVATLFSFPIELVSGILPDRLATHGLFIFEKRGKEQ